MLTFRNFTPNGSMHRYGYDPCRANAASLYQQLQVGEQTLNLAYKSVPLGGSDVVYIEPQGNGSLNGVTYAYQSGAALTANPAGSGKQSLYLPAPAGGSDNLLALCSMDTTSREAAVAGALKVVSYPLTRHRVAIVPVGSAQPNFSMAELRNQLNAIYAPAVIEWEVTQLPAVTATYWDENNDTKLQIPATDYSPEMRGVWQAFLANSNATPGTAYLFIVSAFDSAQYQGYMPIKSSYGFLTPSATPRNAAHELGHGLFNLRHTFSSENAVTLPENTTQNLMDYSNGTELWKYQWDYTHNPEGGWFVFEDSEEGGIMGSNLKPYHFYIRNRTVNNSFSIIGTGFNKSKETEVVKSFLINFTVPNAIVKTIIFDQGCNGSAACFSFGYVKQRQSGNKIYLDFESIDKIEPQNLNTAELAFRIGYYSSTDDLEFVHEYFVHATRYLLEITNSYNDVGDNPLLLYNRLKVIHENGVFIEGDGGGKDHLKLIKGDILNMTSFVNERLSKLNTRSERLTYFKKYIESLLMYLEPTVENESIIRSLGGRRKGLQTIENYLRRDFSTQQDIMDELIDIYLKQ